jgi:hypothetical protein
MFIPCTKALSFILMLWLIDNGDPRVRQQIRVDVALYRFGVKQKRPPKMSSIKTQANLFEPPAAPSLLNGDWVGVRRT